MEHFQITVCDVVDKILPMFDEKLSKHAIQNFGRKGITIKTSHSIGELQRGFPRVLGSGENDDILLQASGSSRMDKNRIIGSWLGDGRLEHRVNGDRDRQPHLLSNPFIIEIAEIIGRLLASTEEPEIRELQLDAASQDKGEPKGVLSSDLGSPVHTVFIARRFAY
ncbi:uncharacterized protein MYCFIDRAFT_176229 [Pseudocercospora fijiensis CIRAD86]|uniref:Uncharacterized protein n=1 Tax=Pseudocercospora fijiensis (strain CIRAD86) TaxID=383855 RepID=M3AUP1_PSEFD|nr:uncharacterized protein MYCFIDRAFT_176229 [Pseudocercospora fijiensis CIRAD86]EME80863.1 hypothetical protein MYCFIDRAFT_176229 [Pseudocercospora fijiensis CIRAD86]